MKILTVFAFTLTAICAPVLAQHQPSRGGVCGASSFDGPNTTFDCEYLGKVKIKQIYEKGWRVVSIGQDKTGGTWTYLLIEEQK